MRLWMKIEGMIDMDNVVNWIKCVILNRHAVDYDKVKDDCSQASYFEYNPRDYCIHCLRRRRK